MMIKKRLISYVLVLGCIFTASAMNEDIENTSNEFYDRWIDYIQKNKNKYDDLYYFYKKDSFDLIKLIIDTDKDKDELSKNTLAVIRSFCTQFPYAFDLSVKHKGLIRKELCINEFMGDKSVPVKKIIQVLNELFTDKTLVGKQEYVSCLIQVVYNKDKDLIEFFINKKFASFVLTNVKTVKNIYHDLFYLIDIKNEKFLPVKLFKMKSLCFFYRVVETFLNHALLNEKEDTEGFKLFAEQKKQYINFLNSKNGSDLFIVALCNKEDDFIDYYLNHPKDAMVIISYSNILHEICDRSNIFSLEEKTILLQKMLLCAQNQGTLKRLLSYDNYSIFLKLFQSDLTSIMRYLLLLRFDIHSFGDDKNILVCFLESLEKNEISFEEKKKVIKIFLTCFNELEQNDLLNPKKGRLPLFVYPFKYNFDMFQFLARLGAHPWHAKDVNAFDFNSIMNSCAAFFVLNYSEYAEGYLNFCDRWKYIKWIVEYSKKQNTLEELFNKKGTFTPLLGALIDREDNNCDTAKFFIKNGARFDSTMFNYLLSSNFHQNEHSIIGLKNLFKLSKHNELPGFFDTTMSSCSGAKIWRFVQELEKSNREDIPACLYALYNYISSEAYQYIKEKIESGESKKTIKYSLGIMRKIESSSSFRGNAYANLIRLNHRLSDEKKYASNSSAEFYSRNKYNKFDQFATI